MFSTQVFEHFLYKFIPRVFFLVFVSAFRNGPFSSNMFSSGCYLCI